MQKSLVDKPAMLFYYIVGGTALFGGVLVGAMENAVLGAVVILGGALYLAWQWYNSVTTTVQWTETGFTVTVQSLRAGAKTTQCRWEDVTATQFYYTTSYDNSSSGRTESHTGHFVAEVEQGEVLHWTAKDGFDELMQLFNERASHLGYRWVPREQATGTVLEDKGPYVAIAPYADI